MLATAHLNVIQNARVLTSSADACGWNRIPPLVGPRVSSYRHRHARNERREPSSIRIIKRTASISLGYLSFRSEEHTSELQSLMRISYAVFCLKKKNTQQQQYSPTYHLHYTYINLI